MTITIETKYSIGDQVWFSIFGSVECRTISDIHLKYSSKKGILDYYSGCAEPAPEGRGVMYVFSSGGCSDEEHTLFPSVEALRDHMFKGW